MCGPAPGSMPTKSGIPSSAMWTRAIEPRMSKPSIAGGTPGQVVGVEQPEEGPVRVGARGDRSRRDPSRLGHHPDGAAGLDRDAGDRVVDEDLDASGARSLGERVGNRAHASARERVLAHVALELADRVVPVEEGPARGPGPAPCRDQPVEAEEALEQVELEIALEQVGDAEREELLEQALSPARSNRARKSDSGGGAERPGPDQLREPLQSQAELDETLRLPRARRSSPRRVGRDRSRGSGGGRPRAGSRSRRRSGRGRARIGSRGRRSSAGAGARRRRSTTRSGSPGISSSVTVAPPITSRRSSTVTASPASAR